VRNYPEDGNNVSLYSAQPDDLSLNQPERNFFQTLASKVVVSLNVLTLCLSFISYLFEKGITAHYWFCAQILVLLNYTECPRRNVPDFGKVFLMLKYTDITQNTYVQSWRVTEIMIREKCGLLAGQHTVPVSWQPYPCPSLSVVSYYGNSAHARSILLMYFLLCDKAVHVSAWHSCHV